MTMRILLALDGSSSSVEARDLVLSLPWPDGTAITLLTAYDIPTAWLGDTAMAGGDWLGEAEDGLRRNAEAELERLAGPLTGGGWSVDRRVVRGRAASVILAAAEELAADLVVVGSRGHGAIASMLLGSVSAEVADHARCAAGAHAAQNVGQAVDVGQRLERRPDDAEDEVGTVDEVPMAVLEVRAQVGHEQLVAGLARAIEKVVDVVGAEQLALGLRLQLRSEGHRMGGREGDVDAGPRRGDEILDHAGLMPASWARRLRDRVPVEPEPDPGCAGRDPAGVEEQHAERQLVAVEGPVSGSGRDQGRRLDRQRRLADPAGERDEHGDPESGQQVRDRGARLRTPQRRMY